MARVFKQRYTQKAPNGRRVTKQTRKWYVEYVDGQGIRRRVRGYTDKGATQELAGELERQAAREQAGLVDRFAQHRCPSTWPITTGIKRIGAYQSATAKRSYPAFAGS